MNELSLFSGAGGGLLGTMLLGFRPIGYVEWDDYCQRVIAARIRDGILPDAPIFGDIKTFIDSGCAELYRGVTDIITAGFPCQPFSVAGKQKGADDARNMWPATAECIGLVRPRFVLLENVPGIRSYLPVVVRDLRRLGYEVSRPLILGADDVGAPHRRKRVWIVAHAARNERGELRRPFIGVGAAGKEASHTPSERERSGIQGRGFVMAGAEPGRNIDKCGQQVSPDSAGMRLSPRRAVNERPGRDEEGSGRAATRPCPDDCFADAPDSQRERGGAGLRKDGQEQDGNQFADGRGDACSYTLSLNGDDAGFCAGEISQFQEAEVFGGDATDADETGRGEQRGTEPIREEHTAPECGGWSENWPEVAARLCRVDDGVAHRVDRLKALGNGQVPQVVAAAAWRILTGEP